MLSAGSYQDFKQIVGSGRPVYWWENEGWFIVYGLSLSGTWFCTPNLGIDPKVKQDFPNAVQLEEPISVVKN